MPHSKVIQAQLTPDGDVDLTVALARVEPGEKVLVQAVVTQATGAIAEGGITLSDSDAGQNLRIRVRADRRAGIPFGAEEPLIAFTQAISLWTSVLRPIPPGAPPAPRWAVDDSGWDGAEV